MSLKLSPTSPRGAGPSPQPATADARTSADQPDLGAAAAPAQPSSRASFGRTFGRSLSVSGARVVARFCRLTAALALCLAAGCVDTTYEDYLPPDDYFDPGPARSGPYGSGNCGSGGCQLPPDAGQDVRPDAGEPAPDAGPEQCAASERRCDHAFSYAGNGGEQSVEVRGDFDGWGSGAPMKKAGTTWSASVPLPWGAKVLYKFRVVESDGKERWIADPANPNKEPDGYNGFNSVLSNVTCDWWTCAPPPVVGYDWRDAVLYFVLVDRFANGSTANDEKVAGVEEAANWQGGDWKGVTEKIKAGYFQELGVNALWLSVPMDQTDRSGVGMGGDTHLYAGYHGYWPKDLSIPEARLGTEAELKELVDAAHAAGMKVLADYAMNHVHEDSPVFQQHKNDGWFNPLDRNGGQCVCGSSACDWNSAATYCWFASYLPDFNFNNADARRYSVDTGVDWAKRFGLDGFRLDAIKHVEMSWLTEFRAKLSSEIEPTTKQHVYLVGETFEYGDRNKLKAFVDPRTKLDGQFDFPLRKQVVENVLMRKGSMRDLAGFMDSNAGYYGAGAVMSTFIGNHDMGRSIHFAQDNPLWGDVYADGKDRNWWNQPGQVGEISAYERLALGFTVLMTNQGIPLVYYGDEIGLPGAGDPDNRRMMNWNAAGYGAGQKWLLERLKKLGAARKDHPALRRGGRSTLSLENDTWAYKMADGADEVFVLLNRADSQRSVNGVPAGSYTDLLSGATVSGGAVDVPARGARILVKP